MGEESPQVGGGRLGPASHDVGDEAPIAGRVLADDDRARSDGPVLAEHGLDLPELDAEATELDLVIDAPEELDLAVGAVPGTVAGAVEARATRAERLRHEPLGRQIGPAEVAAREPGAADAELAGHADGHRLARCASST